MATMPAMNQHDTKNTDMLSPSAPQDTVGEALKAADQAPPREVTLGLKPEIKFGSPIWVRQVNNFATMNDAIVAKLTEIEAAAPAITRSNVGGWHSETILHRLEAFKGIRHIIEQVAVGCAHNLGLDFEKADLVFQSMWANRNGPGDYNTQHVHPNSFLSGSYYLKVPPESGNIEFVDPVRERVMFGYPMKPDFTQQPRRIVYRCREGLLVMFPSWLSHGVQPNRSQDMRLSLAFNIDCVPRPSQKSKPADISMVQAPS